MYKRWSPYWNGAFIIIVALNIYLQSDDQWYLYEASLIQPLCNLRWSPLCFCCHSLQPVIVFTDCIMWYEAHLNTRYRRLVATTNEPHWTAEVLSLFEMKYCNWNVNESFQVISSAIISGESCNVAWSAKTNLKEQLNFENNNYNSTDSTEPADG